MSQAVVGTLKVSTSATETLSNGLSTGSLTLGVARTFSFTTGSGAANKVNESYSHTATLAISTPATLTLSALTDDLGRTVAFADIRAMIITNDGTVDGQPLLVGGATLHPWIAPFDDATATIKIPTGGALVLAAPGLTAFPVVASTSDQLKIDPGANAIPYTIHILGD